MISPELLIAATPTTTPPSIATNTWF